MGLYIFFSSGGCNFWPREERFLPSGGLRIRRSLLSVIVSGTAGIVNKELPFISVFFEAAGKRNVFQRNKLLDINFGVQFV
jgi:hypothetical protein